MTTGVTFPSQAPFLKMPNAKTVITSTVLHIGWVGGSLSIGRRGVAGDGRLVVRGRPLTCWRVGILGSGHDPGIEVKPCPFSLS